jgi:hypothetical protein
MLFRPANSIDELSRGTRQFILGDRGQGAYNNVCNLSLSERIKKYPSGIIENFEVATAPPANKVFNDGGKISLRGPGMNSFLSASGNSSIKNAKFVDTTNYRENASFEKVYPICGTPGYFSIRLTNSPAKYLIAIHADKDGVKFDDVSAMVDVQDGACWRFDTTGAVETGGGMLINKRFPGLTLTVVDENTIKLQEPGGDDKNTFQMVQERALSTYTGYPTPRPVKFSDFEIKNGWDLADMGISYGPPEFRSYELQPTAARTAEACAEKVSKFPLANGFVFIPPGTGEDAMNCRIKVGGYWPELTGTSEYLKNIVSGKLKGDAAGIYKDPIESFNIRRGWNVADNNNSAGSNPSYEIEQTSVLTPEMCATKALQNPKANSFVFIPRSNKNCSIKVGGYWPSKEEPNRVWSGLIGGILK